MKVVKIDKYFPVKCNKLVEEFLSNSDGCFEERSNAFAALLSTVADPTGKDMRAFSKALKELLFDREYMTTHKWALTKYFYYYIYIIIYILIF